MRTDTRLKTDEKPDMREGVFRGLHSGVTEKILEVFF